MTSEGQAEPAILVSYAGPDLMWAEWISEQLERAGCTVHLAEWSDIPATDLVTTLRRAAESHRQCVAVLSSSYVRAAVSTPEAGAQTAAWAAEHPGFLTPVLVRRCDLPARFWQLSPVDLRSVTDDRIAVKRLLNRVPGPGISAPSSTDAEPMTRFPGRQPGIWSPNLPGRNPFFTGRDAMLRDLRRRLTRDVAALVPHSLQGLAGVGKTHLAVEYAYRFAADYDVVWWIPAEKQVTARKSLADLAIRLDLGGPGTEIGELVRAAMDALRTGRPYQRWLLIFDNAGRPDSIRSLVPGGSGDVLITSRDQSWQRYADAVNVDVYAREESTGFLRRRELGLAIADAERLAYELGDLPLALEQAAGWLSTTQMTLDDYLGLLRKQTTEVLDTGRFAHNEVPVATTWTISMNQLRDDNPAAAELLELCAFIGPDPIALSLFAAAPADALPAGLGSALQSVGQQTGMLQAIASYSLAKVSREPDGEPSLQQHRLVQGVVRELVSAGSREAYRRFAHRLLAAADPGGPSRGANWPTYAMLLPHVLASEAVADPDPSVRSLVLHEAVMLELHGDYQSSLEIATAAYDAWSATLDEIDTDIILIRRVQGNALRGLNRFAEALEIDQATYDLALRRLGPDHPDTLLCIGGLASNHRRLGNFAAARELDQHAVDVLTREHGRDDLQALRNAHNLAVDHRLAGEFTEALEINRHGAEAYARLVGPDAFSTIYAVNDTARDLRELGHYFEALSLQEQTFARYREVFGADSPATLRAMKNLALSRRKAGRYAEGAELAKDVLDRHHRKFGDLHAETLAAMTNFANDQRCLGQYAVGRGYAEQAFRGYQRTLGVEHGYTASAAVNLAALIRLADDPEQAREINEDARRRLGRAFGQDHRYTLSCAVNLASDLAALGEIDAARGLGTETLEALRQVSGADHPYTLSCAINLALDLRDLGDRDASRELYSDTMARYNRTLGAGHPESAAAKARERATCDIEPPPV